MIRISVDDWESKRTYSFADRAVVVIGSAPDADLVVAKQGVAPRHVQIYRRDTELVIEDVRAGRAAPRVVDPDAVIRIAGVELRMVLHPLDAESVSDVERDLLEQIRRRPDDPTPRAVYADWLEQSGHRARAEYLRTQLAAGAAAQSHARSAAT